MDANRHMQQENMEQDMEGKSRADQNHSAVEEIKQRQQSAPIPLDSPHAKVPGPHVTGGNMATTYPFPTAVGHGPGHFTEGGTYEMECPPHLVGRIIGRGGETIKRITHRFSVRCNIKQDVPDGAPRIVQISGAPPEILEACGMHIKEVMENGPPEHHTFRNNRGGQASPYAALSPSQWMPSSPWMPGYYAYPGAYGGSPVMQYYPPPYSTYYDPTFMYGQTPVSPYGFQGGHAPAAMHGSGALGTAPNGGDFQPASRS